MLIFSKSNSPGNWPSTMPAVSANISPQVFAPAAVDLGSKLKALDNNLEVSRMEDVMAALSCNP
jgi:hypothetical protein